MRRWSMPMQQPWSSVWTIDPVYTGNKGRGAGLRLGLSR